MALGFRDTRTPDQLVNAPKTVAGRSFVTALASLSSIAGGLSTPTPTPTNNPVPTPDPNYPPFQQVQGIDPKNQAYVLSFVVYLSGQPGADPTLKTDPSYWVGVIISTGGVFDNSATGGANNIGYWLARSLEGAGGNGSSSQGSTKVPLLGALITTARNIALFAASAVIKKPSGRVSLSPRALGVHLTENPNPTPFPRIANAPNVSAMARGDLSNAQNLMAAKAKSRVASVAIAKGVPASFNSFLKTAQLTFSPLYIPALGAVGRTSEGSASWSEPLSAYAPQFPYNHALEFESGHLVEYDDTPGAERIHIAHRSGSFLEMYPDGRMVYKSVGHGYEISLGDKYVSVAGDCHINVKGNTSINVGGDADVQVKGTVGLNATGDIKAYGQNITFNARRTFKVAAATVDLGYISLPRKLAFPTGVLGAVPLVTGGDAPGFAENNTPDAPTVTEVPLMNPSLYSNSSPAAALTRRVAFDTAQEIQGAYEGYTAHLQAIVALGDSTDPFFKQLPGVTVQLDTRIVPAAPSFVLTDFGPLDGVFVYNTNFVLAGDITLGMMTNEALVPGGLLVAQCGLAQDEIVYRLQNLVNLIYLPLRGSFPDAQILTGWTTTNSGTSQHERGEAMDIIVGGGPDRLFAAAQWIRDNLPFDELCLNWYFGGPYPGWLHVSFVPDSLRRSVSTKDYSDQFTDGLLQVRPYNEDEHAAAVAQFQAEEAKLNATLDKLAARQAQTTPVDPADTGGLLQSDGGLGEQGCAAAGPTGHVPAGRPLTLGLIGEICCGTGNEYPDLLAVCADQPTRRANRRQLLDRMIYHLNIAGFNAASHYPGADDDTSAASYSLLIQIGTTEYAYRVVDYATFERPMSCVMVFQGSLDGQSVAGEAGIADGATSAPPPNVSGDDGSGSGGLNPGRTPPGI